MCKSSQTYRANRPNLRHRLATPETYPGLTPKARADRALLIVRRTALWLDSAYALFIEDQACTVRRVQVDRDPAALVTAEASFGADGLITASAARRLIERVRRMLPLAAKPDDEGLTIDGPDMFEIDLDGHVSSFRGSDAFAAEADVMYELIVELDRLLPASDLRMRRGRSSVDEG